MRCCVVVFSVVLAAQPVFAQVAPQPPPSETADANVMAARVHFRTGVKLYEDGNFAGALAEFESAYALKATASSLQNVALCLKALYRYSQAAETLDALLERHGSELSDAERETVRVARDELVALLSTVRFTTSPADAKLTIDGKPVSIDERRSGIRLDVGEHVVEATAPGYANLRQSIRVAAGQTPTLVDLALHPAVVEGVPGPPRDADTTPPSTPTARGEQAAAGGGWYGFLALAEQRPTNPPAGFSHDGASVNGVALGVHGGYRIWKTVALELMLEGARVDVRHACDRVSGDSMGDGCSAPAMERDYSISTFRIGPNLRIMNTSDRLRVYGTLGMGAVSHSFELGETPAGIGSGKDQANDPYLLLELGGELNLGHVLLGLGLSLFFDGGSDLSVDGRDLYPERSEGLGFVGLSLRGGISQWAPK